MVLRVVNWKRRRKVPVPEGFSQKSEPTKSARFLYQTRLSSALTARLVPRSRNRAASCVPDQQLHTLRHHDRRALQKPLAVELFFKWIKHNLRIKHFYGTSENAVKTQIWIAVCVY